MRTMLGLILVLLGGAVMLYGFGAAVVELMGLYQGTFDDPMGQPDGTEEGVSRRMIRSVIIGAVGVPVFIVGSVMLKITLLQRVRGRRG
ncbi:MAG: hypothetical protein ACKVU4_13565 [Phycisphaerales bacterium]